MPRTLWLNPAVGVSGDMLLGALIDVGADEVTVRNALEALDVDGWELVVATVDRRGLQCLHAQVTTAIASEPRTWSGIDDLLAGSSLPSRVVKGSRATFRKLAEVEAERHGVDVDEVHFHEVGAVDAIVDIVGCWAALDALDVTEVRSGPVGLGVGTVRSSHGVLPHPAPAVLGLLEGLPVVGVNSATETATPTGVALLATMVAEWGAVAPGRVSRTGFGAGSRDVETHPNMLTAVMIEVDDSTIAEAVLIETNLDDVTPEILGLVVQQALDAGADDAWLVSIGMKKGRPGHQLNVLCAPGLRGPLVDLIAVATGTLGVRVYDVAKHVFPRSFDEIELNGEVIRMKVGSHGAKPELADVVRVADATGKSARLVAAEALSTWIRTGSEEEAN